MMKFGSVKHSDSVQSRTWRSDAAPPADAPRPGDVLFEIGVILAAHLALALVVTLLLKDCASC